MSHPEPFALPEHTNLEEERAYLKARLAASFRLFGRFGFDEGAAGHITCRDPELTDHFWVNPFGLNFKNVRSSDLLLVSHDGEIVEGEWPLNQAAFAIHSQVHQARPDVIAAAHSHSPYGRAFSALRIELDPLTQDSCTFYEDHALFNDYTGVVNDPEEGKRLAESLGSNKAAILANHGLLTVGASVDSAVWWYITMERTCQVQLAAMGAGKTVSIDPAIARQTHDQIGSELAGAFQFHGLYEWIVREEPDLLE